MHPGQAFSQQERLGYGYLIACTENFPAESVARTPFPTGTALTIKASAETRGEALFGLLCARSRRVPSFSM